AARFLMITKIVDLVFMRQTLITGTRIVFKNSSYGLRTHLLQLLSPDIRTTDVYTYSSDPCKLKNVDYLLKPENWIPDRIDFYKEVVIPQCHNQMNALSKRLNDDGKTIYFIKGGTASGKTTFAKQRFKDSLDENGELTGCLNPDNMKFILKNNTCNHHTMTNLQVHDEAVRGPLSACYDDILLEADSSVIIDRPFPLYEDFEKLLHIAKKKGNKIEIMELHAPLNVVMRRVLQRDAKGKDPCVMPAEIRKSFLEAVRSRKAVIKRIKKEKMVNTYQLFCANHKGELGLVAEKQDDTFQILSPKYFNCLKLPSEAKIQAKMNAACNPMDDIPLYKAIEYKALGLTHSEGIAQYKKEKDLSLFSGPIVTQPFSGDWLRDFPHVLEHIDSEQLRHVRGVDEKGRGLHWQTNKFAWKLNPQFNPEARFQMRIGYFIIPNAQEITASTISESVLKGLKVKSETGNLIGYRFFVHPESYSHFHALHEAGIHFVKSEHSEFIGTPTSSYRSWIVRCVGEDQISPKKGSIPFIVKLGVMQLNDTSRLLPESEVQDSVWTQFDFEKREPNPKLWMFPETFGLSLRYNIENYPPLNICNNSSIDSGMIIREIPADLLAGKCRILSFSALMSVEGVVNPQNGLESSLGSPLPLIFDIINNAIEKGTVKSAFEFIQRYLISDIFDAWEGLLKDTYSLPLHGQNLCLVLDSEDLPIGIAIRDFGDIGMEERYIESYSWFYRYHIICKLLNVLVDTESYYLPPIDGAPVQMGNPIPLQERNLNYYLRKKVIGMANKDGLEKVLNNVSITFEEYQKLLKISDSSFLSLLSRIFNMEIEPLMKDGIFPSAEMGSSQEIEMQKFNSKLFPDYNQIDALSLHR
ncbi:MAG TPA: AAA family ATPase, partial [Parachlamydiaceae bacterium]|nr:AAA family ATPase [Parachlamydiaceae bacterium]